MIDWNKHSIVRILIPFIVGMVGANMFIGHMDMTMLFVLCCMLLAIMFFFLNKNNRTGIVFGTMSMILSMLVGMSLFTNKYQSLEEQVPKDSTCAIGTLSELPVKKAKSWAMNIERMDGSHILLYAGKDWEDENNDSMLFNQLSIGDTIVARTTHMTATSRVKGEFHDYNMSLFHKEIVATAYTPHNKWGVIRCKQKSWWQFSSKEIQNMLHEIYKKHGLDKNQSDIIEAMTLGRKDLISKDRRESYAASGVSHVLALSGFHVGIILIVIQWVFFHNIAIWGWRLISNVATIAALILFGHIAGMPPSLQRAIMMCSILLFCQTFNRELLSQNSCALTAIIMLCWNPFYILDIGFQLSFISVFAIGIFSSILKKLYDWRRKVTSFLLSIAAISLICNIFTIPLVAHYFGRVAVMGIISNLAVTFFVYIIMWGAIAWWAFLWCEPINKMLTTVLNWSASAMNDIVDRIASLPFATIEWKPEWWIVILCYIILLIFSYKIITIVSKSSFPSRKTATKQRHPHSRE